MNGAIAARPGAAARRLRVILRAPFTRRAWDEFRYAMFSLPLAIAGFALTIATLGVGFANAAAVIGLPVLVAGAIGVRWFGSARRRLARRMLGVSIPEPTPLRHRPGVIGWLLSELTDKVAWRARAYLVTGLPVAVAGFFAAVGLWAGGLEYLADAVIWMVKLRTVSGSADHGLARVFVQHYGGFSFDTWPGALLLAAGGVALVLLSPWAVRGVLALDRRLMLRLLGPVSLSARVRDLEQSRAHAVDDSAARLRGIERDLHDGAQAQLVAVTMKLGLAKEKLSAEGGEPADVSRALELVDTAQQTAMDALTELRDLARGIHPPVLDAGLDHALASLAARSAVPVDLIVDVRQRPSPTIEAIAYFCTAELLANVAKHSGARHATVEAVQVPGLLRVRISDDGTGGARADGGSGLRGLADRVRTVDGQLGISSPPGGPTVVTVELPSHA
ncbi:MAG: sensor domain-containing protein [Streptosporangiaceae bacterium]